MKFDKHDNTEAHGTPKSDQRTPTNGWDHSADWSMVQAALRGDPAMTERLVTALHCVDRMLCSRNRRLGDLLSDEDLDDLGQDVRAVVWRRLGDYRPVAAFSSWVYGICEFSLRNAVRSHLRRKTHGDAELTELSDSAPSTEHAAEFHDDLYQCLQLLVTTDQRIVRSKHFEGRTLEQTAARLDMNLNTLKSRYVRSLRRLRDCLQKKGVIAENAQDR